MPFFSLPYGHQTITCALPASRQVDVIRPTPVVASEPIHEIVNTALDSMLDGMTWADLGAPRTAAIAINDKTRPVPHQALLPPLLDRLRALGLAHEAITLIIATGAHQPLAPSEFEAVVPAEIAPPHSIHCHDCDRQDSLIYLGQSRRGTPIWVNGHYLEADLRVVVGNIEPHQFQGFSGGVKSAAIGLAGRATINHNHALMTEPGSSLGQYDANPARQDVEEIGHRIGVHLALNAILNEQKEIVHVLAGRPADVMRAGIPLARAVCQVEVGSLYDLVIAAPGGHPKDINLYQAQKALAHASLIARDGGAVILVAACPEGTGSSGYESWLEGMRSNEEVIDRFKKEGFRVGPHKAYQIARDATRVSVTLVSEMDGEAVASCLLTPAANLDQAIARVLAQIPAKGRIAIMPLANATIPVLVERD